MKIDTSELRTLAIDLGDAASDVLDEADKINARGAFNIKRTMQDEAKSSGYYRHFSRSITYDNRPSRSGRSIEREIGPDKGRTQGALGNILYFGTRNNAPVLDVESGLRKEEPAYVRHMGEMAERLIGG